MSSPDDASCATPELPHVDVNVSRALVDGRLYLHAHGVAEFFRHAFGIEPGHPLASALDGLKHALAESVMTMGVADRTSGQPLTDAVQVLIDSARAFERKHPSGVDEVTQ